MTRSAVTADFPAKFMLVAAMNPCPCGYFGDRRRSCRCSPQQIRQYQAKISGPLLDRIDLHIEVPSVKYRALADSRTGESSAAVKKRGTRRGPCRRKDSAMRQSRPMPG